MNTKEKLELLDTIEDNAWKNLKNITESKAQSTQFLDTIIKVQTIRKGLDK